MERHGSGSLTARYRVPLISVGRLPIAVIDRKDSAALMLDVALSNRGLGRAPALITSANGQVISLCARNQELRTLFLSTDLIHADGMPLVFASRLKGKMQLPERVATTDLFHDVAILAKRHGARFFLLGGTEAVIEQADRNVRAKYPRLAMAGFRNGYFAPAEEDEVVREINDAAPDILWVGMGVPHELTFSLRNRARLTNVGLIKTSGGLFDFLSGKNSRAPEWMQDAGLEWLYRLKLEPTRLFRRYAATNLHAAYLLLSEPTYPLPEQQHWR